MEPLSPAQIALRVGSALLAGALVGIERERKQRPAGFRTMILISVGSCGFVLIGIETIQQLGAAAAVNLPPGMPAPGQAEISRVLQGLIGGIGFLGAGAVLQSKRAVRGITTAAAVWVVSALGAACGLGLYALAAMLGFATLFTLVVLDIVEHRYFPDPEDGAGWDSARKSGKNGASTNGLHATPTGGRADDEASAVATRLRGEGGK
ncbi:MAG: MgtC/SapB family protein [Phycisphaerales bacterium]